MLPLLLDAMPGRFAVCRLDPDNPCPEWVLRAPPPVFLALTRDETSVVCVESVVPDGVRAERGYRALRVEGPLDFALTGILSSLLGPLAEAGVSVLAFSTFDTDYVLVPEVQITQAVDALTVAGHEIRGH